MRTHLSSASILRLSLVFGAVLLSGCDGWGSNPGMPESTKVLGVRIAPNPIVAGDTATFTCVVQDSLDPDLRFEWDLANIRGFVITDSSSILWKAPDVPGLYRNDVTVIDGDHRTIDTHFPFSVSVISRNTAP